MPSEFFISGAIALVSLVYTVLILIMFLLKHNNNNKDSRWKKSNFYLIMLIIAIISMVMYIVLSSFAVLGKNINIFARISMFAMLSWKYATIYYISTAFLTKEEYDARIKKNKVFTYISFIVIVILNIVFSIILPLEFTRTSSREPFLFSGLLYNYFDLWGVVLFAVTIFYLIKYRKRNEGLTLILFIILILLFCFSYLLAYIINLSINSEPLLQSIFLLILYFSVESQDKNLLLDYNESTKKSKESDMLKSEFIINMSHQLRTPMNSILGFSDLIVNNENFSEESVKEDIKNVKESSVHLLNLINSILDISKLESNKEVLYNENYNLENIIYDLSSNINSKLKNNVVFTINVDEICPNDLIGDGYKLCKALNNVIINAMNHTEYGEVSLNVSCIQVDSLNYEFTFLVKNSGHSMLQDNFNLSFEDLIKLSSDNKRDIDSETLDFIVAKGLIDLLGGTMEFINEKGKGTQYIIKLNQKLSSQNRIGNIRERIQTKHLLTHQTLNLVGKKVLIVDENKVNVSLLERLMSQYNIMIETSLNPKDSVELIKNNNYDLVIINHNISDNGGEEIVKNISNVPTIGIVTKNDDVSNVYNYTVNSPIEFRELNSVMCSIFKGGNN